MKYLFAIVSFAVIVAAFANSSVKPTKSDNDGKKAQCNVNNYFYAGPNLVNTHWPIKVQKYGTPLMTKQEKSKHYICIREK